MISVEEELGASYIVRERRSGPWSIAEQVIWIIILTNDIWNDVRILQLQQKHAVSQKWRDKGRSKRTWPFRPWDS